MTNALPQLTTLPASQMRRDQDDIFSRLKGGPLLLTRHGQAAGVLVEPEVESALGEAGEAVRSDHCSLGRVGRGEGRNDIRTFGRRRTEGMGQWRVNCTGLNGIGGSGDSFKQFQLASGRMLSSSFSIFAYTLTLIHPNH